LKKQVLNNYHTYNIFNLSISSEIELPGLLFSKKKPDVVIKFGETPESLGPIANRGILYESIPDKFLLKAFSVARFYLVDGKQITIQPLAKYDLETARVFLLGSVFGALLHQRNFLPLHASAVEFNGKAMVFAGASGAGKSTLAAYLSQHGFSILSDDITVIHFENGKPYILPGLPHIKLWKDAAIKLKLPLECMYKLRDGIEKFIDYSIQPVDKIVPLRHIYILNTQNADGISMTKISGREKFIALKNHIYRKQFITAFGKEKIIFQSLSELALNTEVYRINRQMEDYNIENVAHIINENIRLTN
jgi:hypothetical protein